AARPHAPEPAKTAMLRSRRRARVRACRLLCRGRAGRGDPTLPQRGGPGNVVGMPPARPGVLPAGPLHADAPGSPLWSCALVWAEIVFNRIGVAVAGEKKEKLLGNQQAARAGVAAQLPVTQGVSPVILCQDLPLGKPFFALLGLPLTSALFVTRFLLAC